MFSAIRHDPEPPERVMVGQKRAAEKIGYFQDFLTDLYRLWRAVKNADSNPYFFFTVIRKGKTLLYKALEYITNTGEKLSPVVMNLTSYCHRLF